MILSKRTQLELNLGLTALALALAALGRALGPALGPPLDPPLDPTQQADREPAPVTSQRSIGDMACGPCALYNALIAGGPDYRAAAEAIDGERPHDRIRTLIKTVGSAPSELFPAPRRRYDKVKGQSSSDFEAMADEFLTIESLPLGEGIRFDRGAEEDWTEFLRRIHAELTASASPPVIEIRSFMADAKPSGRSLWDGTGGHYLTVVDVDPIPEGERVSGFLMRCADSWTGRIIPVFAAVERYRGFTCTEGFSVDENGKEKWVWSKVESPYLVVTVPDLSVGTQKADWNERTYIALTWAYVTKP